MDLDKNWLESVLNRRKSPGETPIQVLEFETQMGAIQKGENYLSNIAKIRAEILDSGETKRVGYIAKIQLETEYMKKLSENSGVFLREIGVYQQILPKMEELLDEIDDTGVKPWANCVDVRLYNRLIFEDLTLSGYKVADRRKQLGLDSVLLVMKELGKFHALSRVLLDRGMIQLDVYGKHLWCKDEELIKTHTNRCLEKCEGVVSRWGEEWEEIYQRIRKTFPNFGETYIQTLDADPTEFCVLSHGDLWTNNMMFEYGADPERPTSIKFIDFQLTYLATPDRDLAYFLYSSARLEVIEGHFDQILQTYCDSLKGYLAKFEYKGFIPGPNDVKEMLRQKGIQQLGDSLMVLPFILSDFSDAPDMEEMVKNDMEKDPSKTENSWSAMEHLSVEAENAIKSNFKRAIAYGLI